MKKTKEQIKNDEDIINKILKFNSIEEANELEEIAKGRKFCKRGQRLRDICLEEIEFYVCKKSKNIFFKLYYMNIKRKKSEKLLLETRVNSSIRAIAKEIILKNEDNNETDEEDIIEEVKLTILNKIEMYKKSLK